MPPSDLSTRTFEAGAGHALDALVRAIRGETPEHQTGEETDPGL
jgi:hypothetical protein